MLGFFRKHKPSPLRLNQFAAEGGFTLLEVLVVLALVGLLTAFSLPQFSVIRDRLEFTLNRESFERDLGSLSYLAFKEGQVLVLAGQYPRRSDDSTSSMEPAGVSDPEPIFLEPGQLSAVRPILASPAKLNLPEAWHVTVESPIYFQVSGFCSGGAVKLTIGQLLYVYDVKAPLCQAELTK